MRTPLLTTSEKMANLQTPPLRGGEHPSLQFIHTFYARRYFVDSRKNRRSCSLSAIFDVPLVAIDAHQSRLTFVSWDLMGCRSLCTLLAPQAVHSGDLVEMCAIQVQKSCGFPAVTSGGIKRVGEQSVSPIRVFLRAT